MSKELVIVGILAGSIDADGSGLDKPETLLEVNEEDANFIRGVTLAGEHRAEVHKTEVLARNVTSEQYVQCRLAFIEASQVLRFHQRTVETNLRIKYTEILAKHG